MAIIQQTQVQQAGTNKVFFSVHGKQHDGKHCEPVRALTKDDPNAALAKEWDVAIGMTVCRLDDGTEIAVLNDEVRPG